MTDSSAHTGHRDWWRVTAGVAAVVAVAAWAVLLGPVAATGRAGDDQGVLAAAVVATAAAVLAWLRRRR